MPLGVVTLKLKELDKKKIAKTTKSMAFTRKIKQGQMLRNDFLNDL